MCATTPRVSHLLTLLFALLVYAHCDGSILEKRKLEEAGGGDYEGPLFANIPASESGLVAVNEYSHPEAWKRYWHQYYNGSIGTAVVLGDVNGDSLPDVYLVSKDSKNSLYLNDGDFKFKDVTESAGVAGVEGFGSGASLVDIDNDGDLDLYVCYVGTANQLFVNDGFGRFEDRSAKWGLDINTGSNAPSFADMDRDGDLDLYLQCNFLESANKPEGMPDLLLENAGSRFVDITQKAGIAGRGQGHAAIWWDYNEDGLPDVYVANDFEPTDKLYRNNGDNTFTDVIKDVLVSAPYFGMGADLGDINNDGRVDFIVADMATTDHVKHHVTVGTQGGYLLGVSKSKVSQFMHNMVSLKIGPNQFTEVSNLTGLDATGWTWAVRLVDMDNDGLLDAYFTNGMVREFHNSDLADRLGQARSVMQRIRAYEMSPPLEEENLSFRNLGDLKFEESQREWGLDDSGISFAASYADFDQDGDLDLLVNNLNSPPLLYRNESRRGNRITIELVGEKSNRFGYGAKIYAKNGTLTQVREHSSTRGYMSQDEPLIHFAFASAESIDELVIHWPSGVVQVLEDLDLGFHYRIREANTDIADGTHPKFDTLFEKSTLEVPEETVGEEDFYDAFRKQVLLPFDETWSGPYLEVGDIDGDGWEDIVMGGGTGGEPRVFKNGSGEFLELVESDVFFDDYDSEDTGLTLFDYDNDGDLDFLALAGSWELDEGSEFYRDRIYLNEGGLEFSRLDHESLPSPEIPSKGLAILDVNRDGSKDLLIGSGSLKDRYPFTGDNQVWLRGDEGFYLDDASSFARAFAKSGKVMELLAVDIDQDGDQDLVQANEWGSPVLWINDIGGLSVGDQAFTDLSLKGLWHSLAAGDFNGDGLVDLVFGNIGENSNYSASPDRPMALFSEVIDGVGAHVLASTVEGELRMVETRNIASKLFSREIAAATRSYEEYAKSSVSDIFPDLESRFLKTEINEVRSVALFQRPGGRFALVPLPDAAQIGMANDLEVFDVDGDGFDDIVICHEPQSANPWAGRRLKGHLSLLLGNAEDRFELKLPFESGLETSEFPRRLARADLDKDGKTELLVSQSEGPLLIFEMK